MQRVHQCVLIVSTLLLSWLGMMAVHEFGHVAGAWWTGGAVAKVVLHPLTISRTDLALNPQPLPVAWAGPLLGALLPVGAWAAALAFRLPGVYLLRFFAGFCLIANGAYLGLGSLDKVADAGDLLRHGAALWQLWAFGLVTAPLGLLLWHRLGPHFGLDKANVEVSAGAAYSCLLALVLVVTIELAIGGE